jgi:hypothetical protein
MTVHAIVDRSERILAPTFHVRKLVRVAVDVHAVVFHPRLESEHDLLVAERSALPIQDERW